MSKGPSTFDENEFRAAIEESLGISSADERKPDVLPESDDAPPGQDEAPDIM